MMAAAAWRTLGVLVVIGVAAGLARISAVPLTTPRADRSFVRLSWTARPERVERCRRLSDEELAARPAHMRLRWECEGGFARYLLTVGVADSVLLRNTVRGGGLRHDRPMHVFEELVVSPGTTRLVVALVRLDSSTTGPSETTAAPDQATAAVDTIMGARAAREIEERQRRAGEAIEPRMVLDTTLALSPGQVVLVTYDGERRRLVVRTGR